MKTNIMRLMSVLALGFYGVVLCGCGGSSDSSGDTAAAVTTNATGVVATNTVVVTNTTSSTSSAPTTLNVAGTWDGFYSWDGIAGYLHCNFATSQSGDALSGTFVRTPTTAGTFTGSISGSHIAWHLTFTTGAAVGYYEIWEGNLDSALTTFTGTITPSVGPPNGTFTLLKRP